MVEHTGRGDEIERPVRKRQFLRVALDQLGLQPVVVEAPAGKRQRIVAEIDASYVGAAARELPHQPADAATDVQHPLALVPIEF